MYMKVVLPVVLLCILILNSSGAVNIPDPVSGEPPQRDTNQVRTITETMKVVKTIPATNTIVVSNSENHTFIIDPRTIDLRRFRAGDQVTATLQVTTSIDIKTRAMISKTQLIKLQK